jgi:predicted O-methyltransferase YrrM
MVFSVVWKNKIRMILRFLQYYRRATTVYTLHSPFLYHLADSLLEDKRNFYPFVEIEVLRKKALENDQKITFEDLGAGNSETGGNKIVTRKISQLAKTAVSPAAKCRFLFRMVLWRKPVTMLEIGTSLGLATLYQHAAARKATMITLEGIPAIAAIARVHFDIFHKTNISQITGHFDQTLPQALSTLEKLDYAFIDGNHRKAAVLHYFNLCLEKSDENTMLVIDDIYWSDEMAEAWETIKNHPKVSCTVDLFYFGIVLFTRIEIPQKHNTWIPARYKPWITGL